MRARPDLGSLRSHDVFRAIREATLVAFQHDTFRVVHLSIQCSHIHMIVEARDRMALARGMQGFGISVARRINAVVSERTGQTRRGTVFTDRYHAVILRTPSQVRNTLCYVLNNWRHHGEDRRRLRQPWKIDPYSTALVFDGWKERDEHGTLFRMPPGYDGPLVWRPKTWLLRVGWRKRGLISIHEVPGQGPE
jgi:REP element-mobilizing transposase RayT